MIAEFESHRAEELKSIEANGNLFKKTKEETIRAEAARWLRIYEAYMEANCEEGAYLLPRHDDNEVNESVYATLNALGYECEYKDKGILVKW